MNKMPGRNKLRDRAICALILESGMRVSELCALTIGDVLDGERGKIYCRRKGAAGRTFTSRILSTKFWMNI